MASCPALKIASRGYYYAHTRLLPRAREVITARVKLENSREFIYQRAALDSTARNSASD